MLTTKNVLLIVLFLMGWSLPSFATPPAREELPEPVTAFITYPAGSSPDSQGNFEIEVYCKSHFDIESLEIAIGHSEEIAFDEELPSFNGEMKAGETKLWRIRGMIKENPIFEGMVMPASISLGVRYLYPYKGILKYIEEESRNNGSINEYTKEGYMRRLDELKGRTMDVIKALPVLKPEQVE